MYSSDEGIGGRIPNLKARYAMAIIMIDNVNLDIFILLVISRL